jgi:uncharacterized membrane protein YkvA (DUF1232 family)
LDSRLAGRGSFSYLARTAERKRPILACAAGLGYRDDMASVRESTWAMRARTLEVLTHLPNFVRLYWRLFRDRRVPIWPKALLVGALAYVVLPFDLIPDVLPLIGEVDDLVIVLAAARWFIGWCPPEIVREHARAIDRDYRR